MRNISNAIKDTINEVILRGDIVKSNKDTTITLYNDTFYAAPPASSISISTYIEFGIAENNKKVSTKFALGEAAYILSGRDDVGLARDFPFMSKYIQNDVMIGAYGPYIYKQLFHIITRLRTDPYTRQAIMTIWPYDDYTKRDDKCVDVPCTNYFAFYIDKFNILNLTVVHRSSDVLVGLPYDIVLQQLLLFTVGLFFDNIKLRTICNTAINRHIYLKNGVHNIILDKNAQDKVHSVSTYEFDMYKFIEDKFMPFDKFKAHYIDSAVTPQEICSVVSMIYAKLYDTVIAGEYKKYLTGESYV